MSPQLSIAATASALALAALCLHTPAIESRGGAGPFSPVAAMADAQLPAIALPSILPR